MKVKVFSLSDKGLKDNEYRGAMSISIDGKQAFSVWEGEPEDATLYRDLNDCWSIPSLIHRAFKAGQAGETFEIENVKVDDLEDMPD
jgi:hypothetical protein